MYPNPNPLNLTLTLIKTCDMNRYIELGVGPGTVFDCIVPNQNKQCTKKCRNGCKEECEAKPECGEGETLP